MRTTGPGSLALGGFFFLVTLAAVCPVLAAPFAYVTNEGSNDVSVIDLATNSVSATIPVGSAPRGVVVNPACTKVYVANYGSNDVSVIDTASQAVIAIIPASPVPPILPPPSPPSPAPLGIAVNPAGTRVYVADAGSGFVTIIDAFTNTVVGSVISGSIPFGVAFHPSGNLVYVTNSGEDTVSVIDAATSALLKKIPVGKEPYGIGVTPDGKWVYVADHGESHVSVIDTGSNEVAATIGLTLSPVSTKPYGVAIHPTGQRVYVTNEVGGSVSVIDGETKTLAGAINVEGQSIGVSLNRDGSRLYVATRTTNSVSVIDTASSAVLSSVPVGTAPNAFGQFVAQGVLWESPLSLTLKLTMLGEDPKGNKKFQTLNVTSSGKIIFLEGDLVPLQVLFVSDDGKTTGIFRNLSSVMTDTSGRSESLLLVGTGDFSSSFTGTLATGTAYLDAKGTLKKDSSGAITSISLNGKIAGGTGQVTVFSTTLRATLTQ